MLENEHKQTEKKLRESEERLKIILESVKTGIVIIDSETHRIVDANPFVSKLIGAPQERIIGSICHKYICPAEEGRCPITDLGQTVDNAERVLLTAGGRSCPVIKNVEPVMLGGRKHLLESFADITERKRAEEALREREEKYRTLLDTMEEGYFEHDLKGNFSFVNDSLCKMVNASSKDELIGLNHRDYMDKEPARKVYKIFREVYKSGQPAKMLEYEVTKRDGQKIFQESSVYLMRNAQGEAIGFRGIVRDITERKKAEETLRESEKETQRRAQEAAVIAEIGHIISSTLDLDVVYERFAQEAKKLIEFDRIAIGIIDRKESRVSLPYVWGTAIAGRQSGDGFALPGSLSEEVLKRRSSLVMQMEDEKELAARFPPHLPFFQAGLRSTLLAPLIAQDTIIGNLVFYSKKSNAYKAHDLKIAESIGSQIAGAIANAQLYRELAAGEATVAAEKKKAEELEALN